jgi:hypothetical protein
MSSSEKAAQKARADRLRAKIEELKSGGLGKKPAHETPRDFTERKMREAEKASKDTDKG